MSDDRPRTPDEVEEALAVYAHEAWSGWMRYLWSMSEDSETGDGSIVIPASLVNRWTRQMNTPYADLPDNEQESDRKEARKILDILDEYHAELVALGADA